MILNVALLIALCLSVCVLSVKPDEHESCGFWAENGECQKNPGYMLASCASSCRKASAVEHTGSFYPIIDTDIHGEDISFERFRNKVVFAVNVASYCGYTAENYELFRSLRKYIPWGLEIVIFPSNQFGQQEPGSSSEIEAFVNQQKFDGIIMSKGDVNGENTRDAYKFLKQFKGNRDIGWNFEGKFLVDRSGHVTVPGKNIEAEIKSLLEQPAINEL